MANLGLKLKVFFLMTVVIIALSAANFLLFKDFIAKIDVQEGAKNSAELVEEKLKNINYALIGNSFEIAKNLKIEKGKVVSKISSDENYAVVDQNGSVIDENVKVMNSYNGIPAVDRALKSGVASDGMFSVENSMYLVGAVPVISDGDKIFAVVTFKKVSDKLISVFPMPVRVFRGSELFMENGRDNWRSVESSYGKLELDADMAELIRNSGQKVINGWTKISSFAMPYDLKNGEKISIVTMTSFIPGWESYNKVRLGLICYSAIAIIIALFFTFIVTYSINKILRDLASDVSRMRVGEKLVLKKYSNGADIVVSALNTLISNYLKLKDDDVSGITASPLVKKESKGIEEFEKAIADPFATESVENAGDVDHDYTSSKPKAQTAAKPAEAKSEMKSEVKPVLPEINDDDDDDDDEKTQIASTIMSASQKAANPMDALWEDYCKIKRKYGESVSEKEKISFLGKVRTNKASIMAKYKCSDVIFSVEEKDGKPVIKAKPVN